MNPLAAVRALGPVDLRNVARDPLLRWMAVLPVAIALAIRAVMPPLLRAVGGIIDYDLAPHSEAILGFILLTMMPNIAGIVIGFLLLDQRDDGTLSALQVTPLSLTGYLAYRLTAPMAISFLLTPILFPVAGLTEARLVPVLFATLAAAPLAPALALFIVGFARNKVQGFALMKAAGGVMWPPLAAYFVAFPWKLAIAPIPSFWTGILYWSALEGSGSYWVWLPAGLAWQGLLVALLIRRFLSVMHRN